MGTIYSSFGTSCHTKNHSIDLSSINNDDEDYEIIDNLENELEAVSNDSIIHFQKQDINLPSIEEIPSVISDVLNKTVKKNKKKRKKSKAIF